ncbi:TRAP transporter small permease [Cohaesibacter sp. CAU 1516]|uniref:TRAP transporter small permease n=1 Tax=Cohaesibacter sp. CAU 1516 TaxID=2576038 RepID=UPI0010FE8526|nr:TRAP transporter small permease [Cohaesibacter sp. CAU 1516]TLP47001.1 TRAP transporter small permease [Cohaesibacter sp. CAU 1516]
MLAALEKGLNRINSPIGKLGSWIGGSMLIVMTVIVLLQILFRYVLNMPLSWTDEASRFLMIYMVYLCLPIIYLQDKNIAMTFLLDALNGLRIKHLLMILIHCLAILTFLVWIKFGYDFFARGSSRADSLPITMNVIYIAPPLLMGITLLSALQKIVSELRQFIHFKPAEQEPQA